jgi:hypothetical protein
MQVSELKLNSLTSNHFRCGLAVRCTSFPTDMESRKRPHLDDGEPLQAKKRALASPNGTPYINGVVADTEEPRDNDSLEVSILSTTPHAISNILRIVISQRSHFPTDEALLERTRAKQSSNSRAGTAEKYLRSWPCSHVCVLESGNDPFLDSFAYLNILCH